MDWFWDAVPALLILIGAVGLITNLVAHRPGGGQTVLGSIGTLCLGASVVAANWHGGHGDSVSGPVFALFVVTFFVLRHFDRPRVGAPKLVGEKQNG
jgi:hypothetical protein